MTENKKKILSFYKFEYDYTTGTYTRKAHLGELMAIKSISTKDVENFGEEYLCKILSSMVRKLKKGLAKQFLLSFNFYELIKKQEDKNAVVINPHFITDTIIALDIFDDSMIHYLGIVNAELKRPKIIYFSEKEDSALDCISYTIKFATRIGITSEAKVREYYKKDKNLYMR